MANTKFLIIIGRTVDGAYANPVLIYADGLQNFLEEKELRVADLGDMRDGAVFHLLFVDAKPDADFDPSDCQPWWAVYDAEEPPPVWVDRGGSPCLCDDEHSGRNIGCPSCGT